MSGSDWGATTPCAGCQEPLDALDGERLDGWLLCEWCYYYIQLDAMAGLAPPELVALDAGTDFGG